MLSRPENDIYTKERVPVMVTICQCMHFKIIAGKRELTLWNIFCYVKIASHYY